MRNQIVSGRLLAGGMISEAGPDFDGFIPAGLLFFVIFESQNLIIPNFESEKNLRRNRKSLFGGQFAACPAPGAGCEN